MCVKLGAVFEQACEVAVKLGGVRVRGSIGGRSLNGGAAAILGDFAGSVFHRRCQPTVINLVLSPLVQLQLRFGPVPHRRPVFANAKTSRTVIGR